MGGRGRIKGGMRRCRGAGAGWGSDSQQRVNGRSETSQTRGWRTCRGTRSCGEAGACSEAPAWVHGLMLRRLLGGAGVCSKYGAPEYREGADGGGEVSGGAACVCGVCVCVCACGAENPRFHRALCPCASEGKKSPRRAYSTSRHCRPYDTIHPTRRHHGVDPPSTGKDPPGCTTASLRQAAAVPMSAHIGCAGRHASASPVRYARLCTTCAHSPIDVAQCPAHHLRRPRPNLRMQRSGLRGRGGRPT